LCIKDFILFFVISDAIASFEIFLYIGALLPQWNQTRTLSCYILKLLRWYFLTWHSQIQFLMSWSVLAWNKNLYQNLPGIWGCANCWVSPRPMLLLWIFSIWICNSINLTPPFFLFFFFFGLFMSMTDRENEVCTCCWYSWPFSSSTQTRWVLASSSWHGVCCWCFGILTQLECSFRVIISFKI